MINEIELFKNAAQKRDLCATFNDMWSTINTHEDFVRFSLNPKSISYVALSTYEGWGLSTDFIEKEFSKYINNPNVSLDNGNLFCKANEKYTVFSTENNIMDSTGVFIVPKTKCPIFHVNNKSNVEINCEGMNIVKIYLYDISSVNINIKLNCKVFVMSLSEHSNIKCNIPDLMKVRYGDVKHYAYGQNY